MFELLINFKTVSFNNYTNKEILMKKYVFTSIFHHKYSHCSYVITRLSFYLGNLRVQVMMVGKVPEAAVEPANY